MPGLQPRGARIGRICCLQGRIGFGQQGFRTLQTGLRLRHIRLRIGAKRKPFVGLLHDAFVACDIFLGQLTQHTAAQQIEMGYDGIERHRGLRIQQAGLCGIKGGPGHARSGPRGKAVPERLHELGRNAPHAEPLLVQIIGT